MKFLLNISFFILIGLSFIQCENEAALVQEGTPTTIVETPEDEPLEQSIDDKVGKFLAGIELDNLGNEQSFDADKWGVHATQLKDNWSKMESSRLAPMNSWVKRSVNPVINDTLPLFYPFSGPDFLHANYLFPDASNYILMALEPIGDLPDFSSMSQSQMDNYLKNINRFLRDIYKRSYFITKSMDGDVHSSDIKGILPVLYVFIERSDYEIIGVERIGLDGSGNIVPKDQGISKKLDGVRFSMRKNGTDERKELVYWDCDISNSGLEKTPELALYLSKINTSNTFIKSASYLLHYSTFSQIREIVLSKSKAVLEDDTGIPYKCFDQAKWNARLYGRYTKPIADFNERLWQADLQEAYDNSDQFTGKLPFSLGYHWSDGAQNYMLYLKK